MDSEEDKSKEGEEGEHTADDTSSASDANNKTEERYAALRNHQIRFADAIDPNAERVHKLQKNDIVFGRGRGFQNHPGNQRMRDVIEKYKTQYHSLKRGGKHDLVQSVFSEITDGGGRFLKKLDGEDIWVVVDRPIALQKVSHTMRCRKSIIKQLDGDGQVPEVAGGPSNMPENKDNSEYANPNSGAGSLYGAVARTSAAGYNPMNMLRPQSVDTSMAGLEAQRMAALNRYRALSGMAPSAPTMPAGMGHYEMLRREQAIRDTMMYQQMGDPSAFNSAFMGASLPTSQRLAAPSTLRYGSAQESPGKARPDAPPAGSS
jgi:hypothetical protein